MLSRRIFVTLGGAAVLGVGAYHLRSWHDTAAPEAGKMTPPQALAAAQSGAILLVDIRRPDEWAATGVAAPAIRLDMRRADFIDALDAHRSAPNQPIALICARGVRSARLTRRLLGAGIAPIIDVPEGMLGSSAGPGWLARGLPVTKA